MLGISLDAPERNKKFAEKNQFPFPLLSDEDRKVALAYGACDSPSASSARRMTFVIGPEGKILQVHEKVNAERHPEELLHTL